MQFVEKIFSFYTHEKDIYYLKKIVIHNRNHMRAIVAVKNTFDAMVVDNSHKYLRKLRYL